MKVQRGRPKVSAAWEHFVRCEDGKSAECKICDPVSRVKISKGSTSGLLRHYKIYHQNENQVAAPHPETPESSTEMEMELPEMKYDPSTSTSCNKEPSSPAKELGGGQSVPRRRKARSSVWQHFTQSEDRKSAECKICNSVLKRPSTTNLVKHFRSFHLNGGTTRPSMKIWRASEIWKHFTKSEDGMMAKCNLCECEPGGIGITLKITGGRNTGLRDHLQRYHYRQRKPEIPVERETKETCIKSNNDPSSESEGIMVVRKVRRLTSTIWTNFTRLDKDTAQCKTCNAMVTTKSGKTWSMRRHYRVYHETSRKPPRSLEVWQHFTRSEDGMSASCNKCGVHLQACSTSVLSSHIRSYHEAVDAILGSNKPTKHKSPVWQYFIRSEDKKSARCKICDVKISALQGSTGTLLRHYRIYHQSSSTSAVTSAVWQHFLKNEDGLSAKCKLCDLEIKISKVGDSIPLLRHFKLHHTKRATPNVKKKRSKVWAHFTQNEGGLSAKCKVCGVDIKTVKGSTGALFTHFNNIHFDHASNMRASPSPASNCEDSDEHDDWEPHHAEPEEPKIFRPTASCLFCHKSNPQPTPSLNEILGAEKCSELEKQLQQVFILRHLLYIPSSWCEEALIRNDGECNPDSWFRICSECIEVVSEGWKIYQKMLGLESKMKLVKDKIKNVIQESAGLNGGDIETGIDNEIRKRLSDFVSTIATRECVKTIKLEVSDSNMDLNDDYEPFIPSDSGMNDSGEEDFDEVPKTMPEKEEECGSPTKSENELELSKHDNLFPIKHPCKRCDFVGDDIWKLRTHVRKEHSEHANEEIEQENKTCSTCSRNFPTLPSLVNHQRKMHPILFGIEEEIIACDQCDLIFSNKLHLHYHKRNTHLRVNSFMCDTCGKAFSTVPFLERHKKTTHGERFMCDLCGLDYSSQEVLDKHVKREHSSKESESSKPNQEEIYKCKHCDLTSHFRPVIKRHMLIHKREMGIQCDICQKYYFTKKGLKLHKKMSHSETREQFKCPHCCKPFTAQNCVNRHLRSCPVKRLLDDAKTKSTSTTDGEREQN